MSKNEAKKKPATKKKGQNSVAAFLKSPAFQKICGGFLILFALFLAVVFVSYFFSWNHDYGQTEEFENWGGKIGFKLANFFIFQTFGIASLGYVVLFLSAGFKLLNINMLKLRRTSTIVIFWMVWTSLFFGLIYLFTDASAKADGANTPEWISILAGVVGYSLATWIDKLIGIPGLIILLLFAIGLGLWLIHHVSFMGIVIKINETIEKRKAAKLLEEEEQRKAAAQSAQPKVATATEPRLTTPEKKPVVTFDDEKDILDIPPKVPQPAADLADNSDFEIIDTTTQPIPAKDETEEDNEEYEKEHYTIDEPYDPRLDLRDYQFPSTDVLEHHEDKNEEVTRGEMVANKDKIVKTLKNYSIEFFNQYIAFFF